MTCKDCLHYDVCKYKNRQIPLCDEFCYETDHVEDIGCPFKDKSKFIELPCKVGDTVWVIWQGLNGLGIYQDSIFNFTIYGDIITYETDHLSGGVYGTNLFSTREEAEKALKERESK